MRPRRGLIAKRILSSEDLGKVGKFEGLGLLKTEHWYTNFGDLMLEAHDTNAAVKYYLIAFDINPNSPSITSAIALCLEELSRVKEAIRWMEEAFKLLPNEEKYRFVGAEYWHHISAMRTLIGEEDGAIAVLQKSLRCSPSPHRYVDYIQKCLEKKDFTSIVETERLFGRRGVSYRTLSLPAWKADDTRRGYIAMGSRKAMELQPDPHEHLAYIITCLRLQNTTAFAHKGGSLRKSDPSDPACSLLAEAFFLEPVLIDSLHETALTLRGALKEEVLKYVTSAVDEALLAASLDDTSFVGIQLWFHVFKTRLRSLTVDHHPDSLWEAALQVVKDMSAKPSPHPTIYQRIASSSLSGAFFQQALKSDPKITKNWLFRLLRVCESDLSPSILGSNLDQTPSLASSPSSPIKSALLREREGQEKILWKQRFQPSILKCIDMMKTSEPKMVQQLYASLGRILWQAGDIPNAMVALSVTLRPLESHQVASDWEVVEAESSSGTRELSIKQSIRVRS
jgi:tetratricopeptide (TPR) repeat protein